MTTKTARLDRLEKGAAVALQKKRGCNEADTWANFVYDCYKRWETWWLCVKWQWPPRRPNSCARTNGKQ